MPSIAWFPLAIVLFRLSEGAIMFVVVMGAAPAVANGLITGTDHIPPILLRAGRVLGARGLSAYRHVVLPASLPAFVGGLKQGWAFAWRSLMAGELLGVVPGEKSIGVLMQNSRSLSDLKGPDGVDDRHPRHRHRGRLGVLRDPRSGDPPPLGTPRRCDLSPTDARHRPAELRTLVVLAGNDGPVKGDVTWRFITDGYMDAAEEFTIAGLASATESERSGGSD